MHLIEIGHHQVNADSDPDLRSHGILSCAENAFHERKVEVIYQSMEEFLEYRSLDTRAQMRYDRLYNRRLDIAKISKFLSVDSFIKKNIGLEMCVSLFLKNQEFKGINWAREVLIDKSVGARATWSDIRGLKKCATFFVEAFN